jgi:hypothetical protein
MIMGMVERDLGITVFRSRVESLRGNTSEFPIKEIHVERLPAQLDVFYVSFVVGPMQQLPLCKAIRSVDRELLALRIEACPKRDHAVELYTPQNTGNPEGILICPMICANPALYSRRADLALLLRNIATQFGTPKMGFPHIVDQLPIDSILIKAMRIPCGA